MGHYGWFPNGNWCDVWTSHKLGHMLTSRISIKEIHECTAQLPYARCEVCLRYFTKSLRATVFMQMVYSTVVRGKQRLGL